MSELFGAPSGFQGYAQMQDTQAQTLQRLGEFAQVPANLEHTRALTELNRAQTQQMLFKARQEQAMLQKLAQMEPPKTVGADGKPATLADQMEAQAQLYLSMGMAREGADLANKASEMRTREQAQTRLSIEAKNKLLDKHVKTYEDLYNFLSGATDEASFNQLKMAFMAQHPDEPIPPELSVYNPALIDSLRNVTKSGLEKVKRDAAAARDAENKRYHKDLVEQRREHDKLVTTREESNIRLRDTLRQNHQKVAGKKDVIGTASRDEVSIAQSMIREEYPNLASDVDLGKEKYSRAAVDLANEAKAYRNTHPGTSATEAMATVYKSMKEQGFFKDTTTPKTFFGVKTGETKSTTYTPKQKAAAAKAAPAERYIPGKTVPVKGKTYDPGDGSKWQWDGKQMVNVE